MKYLIYYRDQNFQNAENFRLFINTLERPDYKLFLIEGNHVLWVRNPLRDAEIKTAREKYGLVMEELYDHGPY